MLFQCFDAAKKHISQITAKIINILGITNKIAYYFAEYRNIMFSNNELSQLNERINAENSNRESLERLAQILYNVDASAKSSVKINEENGIFYIKDWSGQIAALAVGRGANFYGLVLGATASLSGAALLAEKRRLYEIGTGLNFSPLAGAPVSKPANKPARGTAKEKKKLKIM